MASNTGSWRKDFLCNMVIDRRCRNTAIRSIPDANDAAAVNGQAEVVKLRIERYASDSEGGHHCPGQHISFATAPTLRQVRPCSMRSFRYFRTSGKTLEWHLEEIQDFFFAAVTRFQPVRYLSLWTHWMGVTKV